MPMFLNWQTFALVARIFVPKIILRNFIVTADKKNNNFNVFVKIFFFLT